MNINSKQTILKLSKSPFINDSVKHIGYPLTNKDLICNLDFIDTRNKTPYFTIIYPCLMKISCITRKNKLIKS